MLLIIRYRSKLMCLLLSVTSTLGYNLRPKLGAYSLRTSTRVLAILDYVGSNCKQQTRYLITARNSTEYLLPIKQGVLNLLHTDPKLRTSYNWRAQLFMYKADRVLGTRCTCNSPNQSGCWPWDPSWPGRTWFNVVNHFSSILMLRLGNCNIWSVTNCLV